MCHTQEAIALIDQLCTAKENYVRQGAVIALAFIMIQQTDSTCRNVNDFRQKLTKMITEKGEDSITKFGAIIAQGILDAGMMIFVDIKVICNRRVFLKIYF
jgi:26S proteasome regulatory subunit N2